jgi:hypothetical protein
VDPNVRALELSLVPDIWKLGCQVLADLTAWYARNWLYIIIMLIFSQRRMSLDTAFVAANVMSYYSSRKQTENVRSSTSCQSIHIPNDATVPFALRT